MNRRIQSLEKRVETIKRKLAQLGDLRPGCLSKQHNVCGNPHCRCKASPPKKHGPYYQLSSTRKGMRNQGKVWEKSVERRIGGLFNMNGQAVWTNLARPIFYR